MNTDLFNTFPDYVPEKVCLECQGCCRFNALNSQWRPKISQEEIGTIHDELELGREIYSQITVDQEHFLKAYEMPLPKKFTAECQCTFFNIENNKCKIYKRRPFDCRLYPFLLVKKNDEYFVGVHLNCPFIEQTRYQKTFKDQVEKLRNFFSQNDVLEYFKRNKFLAGEYIEYQNEVDCLFKIAIT